MKFEYQTGFGNEFASEAVEGALAGRPELSAKGTARAVCRTVFRNSLHRTAGPKQADLDISHSTKRPAQAVPAVCRIPMDCKDVIQIDAV